MFSLQLFQNSGKPFWPKLIWEYFKTPRFNPLEMTKDNKSVIAFNLSYLFKKQALFYEIMEKLIQAFEQGKLVPPRITTYPLKLPHKHNKIWNQEKLSVNLFLRNK